MDIEIRKNRLRWFFWSLIFVNVISFFLAFLIFVIKGKDHFILFIIYVISVIFLVQFFLELEFIRFSYSKFGRNNVKIIKEANPIKSFSCAIRSENHFFIGIFFKNFKKRLGK